MGVAGSTSLYDQTRRYKFGPTRRITCDDAPPRTKGRERTHRKTDRSFLTGYVTKSQVVRESDLSVSEINRTFDRSEKGFI